MTVYGLFLCNQAGRLINQQLQPTVPSTNALQTPPQLPGGPWQLHATKTKTTWEFTSQHQTLTRLLVPIKINSATLAEPDQSISLVLKTKVVNQHVGVCWNHAMLAAKPAYPVSYGKPTPYSQARKFWYQPAPHTRINVITIDYDHLPVPYCPPS